MKITTGNTIMTIFAAVWISVMTAAFAIGWHRRGTVTAVDDLETRMAVTLKVELSKERALRVWPAMEDPESDISRRVRVIHQRWLDAGDDRLLGTDWPFQLAREASTL